MSCGTCTLCCKIMGVTEIDKPRNAWCAHCAPGKGCAIYDTRPQSCIEFDCTWLLSQGRAEQMAPELRPDRCKVVLSSTTDGEGVVAHVDESRPDAFRRDPVRRLLAHLANQGVTVIVAIGERRIMLGSNFTEIET